MKSCRLTQLLSRCRPLSRFNPLSYLAVDVFFLLSGFVIAHSYEAKLSSGRISVLGFMGQRLLRLYPMYLLALLLEAAASGASLAAVVRGALFIPTFGAYLFPLVFVAWSLLFELLVNALYAVARPWLTTRRLLAVAGMALLGVIVAGVRLGEINAGWYGSAPAFLAGFARATFGIFLGVALFRHRGVLGTRVPRALRPAGAVIAIVLILCASAPGPAWVYDVLALLAFPVLVLAAAREEPPAVPVMLMLGAVSYPMYLLHDVVHTVIQNRLDVARWAPLSGIVFAVALSALCIAAERLYDLPVRRSVKAWVDGRRSVALSHPNSSARSSAEPGPKHAPDQELGRG